MPRRIKLSLLFVGIVAVGYGLYHLVAGARGVPQEFTDARVQGAFVAQTIVNISNEMSQDLQKVNEFDAKYQFAEALNLTLDLAKRSDDIRTKAVELSGELAKMTQSLSGVASVDARQVALESISNRLALITTLVSYSNDLSNLISALRDKFVGHRPATPVKTVVDQINGEVSAINNFNREASQAMDRFDKLTK